MADLIKQMLDAVMLSPGEVFNVTFSLAIAIIVAVIISQVYKRTHRGMNYELGFMGTLVLLAPVVALVMMFIRGDLVLSLGLIGSLSIIRFRTPIKDSRDMVFLFWTIASGLGAGTYNWMLVILACLIMVPLAFLLYTVNYGGTEQRDFVLIVAGNATCPTAAVDATLRQTAQTFKMRSQEMEQERWELVYELALPPDDPIVADNLLQQLKENAAVQRVSLLAPQLNLPV